MIITKSDITRYKEAIDKVWLPLLKDSPDSKEAKVWSDMFDYFDDLLVTGEYK